MAVRRLWFPLLLGLVGVAILCALGLWQLDRMGQKEALLDRIEARIGAAPVPLPAAPDPATEQYLPVTVTGALRGGEAPVLTSLQGEGTGYRVVAALDTGERRLLVDLGFAPEADKDRARLAEDVTVTGNLLWPNDVDSWTPAPDLARNLWFARDLPAMAEALGTEPLLVVARRIEGADLGTIPVAVDMAGIPNNHYEYAITWFGLAMVWVVMSLVLIQRVRRGTA
ncbi:SURF1 family protein [Rubellimicrobium roseum]|uniref:SURF1-like protein n=1 Tax=Rubellimicrobium roseum TaxID=687525 RepID=A0A5C4NBK2_9RHOB|nr:SURF1 family protein [Rubellimicrobium roseum]TNC70956.1 SURF1 family protein [Rubellimicrobium roseum]